MIILGIDPGYAIMGYGLIKITGMKLCSIAHGAITTENKSEFKDRLAFIYDNLTEIIRVYKPDVVAMEKLYFQNNHKTAIGVAEAKGVILLATQKLNLKVYEYTPLQIKMSVTGYGKAKKQQVMEMTKKILKLEHLPKLDDTCDALAVALCHANIGQSDLKLRLVHGIKRS